MKQLLWMTGVLVLLLQTCASAPARKEDDSLYSILKRLDTVLDDLLVKVEGDQEVHRVEQRNEDGALPEFTDLDLDKRRKDSDIRSPPTENIDDDDASLLQVLQWLQSMRSHRKETRGDHDIPFP